MLLGCIADDLTGASDLALMLAREGLRTVQVVGIPGIDEPAPECDAIVISLKSRTIPPREAVAQSLAALEWLRCAGSRQYFFKYCSTFDSTPDGNIGPVADALLDALGGDFTIACPAFPANRRTIYLGHLFVGDDLLSNSSMRHHPLTPMTESNLVAVLGRQTPHKVGLVPFDVVSAGAEPISARFADLRAQGVRHAIVDALTDGNLRAIGTACRDLALVTGGSGVAMGLPENFRARRLVPDRRGIEPLSETHGYAAVIAGSCSAMTLRQVAEMQARHPSFVIDPLAIAAGDDVAGAALAWALPKLANGPVLVYASAPPDRVADIQERLGRAEAGEIVERTLATVARGLVAAGVGRLVVAGGETAGAVVAALGAKTLRIGPEIAPGVCWSQTIDKRGICLALKSGNFGDADFFRHAFEVLQ